MFTLYTLMLQVPLALAQDTSNTETDSTDDTASTETSGTETSDDETVETTGDESIDSPETSESTETDATTETINPVTLDVMNPAEIPNAEVVTAQTVYPVWHFGPDIYLSGNLATSYASASSQIDRSQFESVSPMELMELPMRLSGAGSIEGCPKTNMSNARLKKLTQELDMALAYYELDLAQEKFAKAEQGLLCLNSILDTDLVSRLYYLQGLLEYNNGNETATKQAYRNAIRFQANLNWDNMFAPDSQPLFEAAKKELATAEGVTINVFPKSAESMLWINGIPASDEDSLTLHYGDNMLQYEGVDMENAIVFVEDDATEITLIIPGAIDKEIIDWVNTPAHQEELDTIVRSIYPTGHTLYAMKEGLLYSTVVTANALQWTEQDIPKITQVFGVNTKRTIGRGLIWTGAALTTVGGLYSTNQYINAGNAIDQAKSSPDSWEVFEQQQGIYNDAAGKYQAGMIVTGTGMALTGLGYWLERQ